MKKKEHNFNETQNPALRVGDVIKRGIKYRIGSCSVRTTLNDELTIGSITLPCFYNGFGLGEEADFEKLNCQ